MKKRKIILLIIVPLLIVAGTGAALYTNREKEITPEDVVEGLEKSAREVLGDDFQKVSATQIVATIAYGSEEDEDNNIYYRILKTTYYEGGDPSAVTGLNTDALEVLFYPASADSYEEMMIKDWYGALYKKGDTGYLCWTYDPEVTYVLEYTLNKIPDSEIIKMAQSAEVPEE